MRARVWGRSPGRAIRTAGVRTLPVVFAVLAVLLTAGASQAASRMDVAGVLAEADGSSSGPPVVLPRIDCASLAGQDLSGTPGAPAVIGSATETNPFGWPVCEVKGIAAPQIQFDVLLPTKTWRQRYLQTGCEAYCGSADADPQLRVDFGYRSEHVLALVAKRLIALYYGQGPRYSYFDGCSSPRD
jgi:feruloyl esterase